MRRYPAVQPNGCGLRHFRKTVHIEGSVASTHLPANTREGQLPYPPAVACRIGALGGIRSPRGPMLTSDVSVHSIRHHENDPRHRRPDPERGQGHPREGGPIDWGGRLRTARRGARPSPSGPGSTIVPLDLSPHEASGRYHRQGERLRGPRCRPAVSYSLDVNVLLYASDRSSDGHLRARRFVETCAAGPEILCLTWPTLMSD